MKKFSIFFGIFFLSIIAAGLLRHFLFNGNQKLPNINITDTAQSQAEQSTGTNASSSLAKPSQQPVRPQSKQTSKLLPSVLTLSREAIIAQTNIQRQQNGNLPALVENNLLNQSAQLKLKDLFAKQYFEHISPSGVGPNGLANTVGYGYIEVGENLALGDFSSNQDLISSWMASSGHRANILNAKFMEIGVAVAQGDFLGHKVWIAVQEFGRPLSNCPLISPNLKPQIDSLKTEVDSLQAQIAPLKTRLDSSHPQTQADYDEYNAMVQQYNYLVDSYNNKTDNLKSITTEYNNQVKAYNLCAK